VNNSSSSTGSNELQKQRHRFDLAVLNISAHDQIFEIAMGFKEPFAALWEILQ